MPIHHIILTTWNPDKGKTIEKVKYQWLPWAGWQKGKINSET